MLSTISAPYATKPIPLHLSSLTGMRYRILNCMECGREFLERNNDTVYRIGDSSQPRQVAITSNIQAICGHCSQQYTVSIAIDVTVPRGAIPLYMQPQSVYLLPESDKHLRQMHCLECGKVFQRVSDRIGQVVDNYVPLQYVEAHRLGSIESMCSFKKCKQLWSFIV